MEYEGDPSPQARRAAIPLGFGLFIGSLAAAWHAASLILSNRVFHGFEFIGLAVMVFSGCLDPINFLWLCLPFTTRRLTQPMPYAHFKLPLSCIGLIFLVAGWAAVHKGTP